MNPYANGGCSGLDVYGKTASVNYKLNKSLIEEVIGSLQNINSVTFNFDGDATPACFSFGIFSCRDFYVTFVSVADKVRDLPLITSKTKNVEGTRLLFFRPTSGGNLNKKVCLLRID